MANTTLYLDPGRPFIVPPANKHKPPSPAKPTSALKPGNKKPPVQAKASAVKPKPSKDQGHPTVRKKSVSHTNVPAPGSPATVSPGPQWVVYPTRHGSFPANHPFMVPPGVTPPRGSVVARQRRTPQGDFLEGVAHAIARGAARVESDLVHHPEHAAVGLSVAAVLTAFLGPEAGAAYLSAGADLASGTAAVKAAQRGERFEAILDTLSVGAGVKALVGRVESHGFEDLAMREKATIRRIFEQSGSAEVKAARLSGAETVTLRRAIREHRELLLEAEGRVAKAQHADEQAALLALFALDPALLVPSRMRSSSAP